GLGSGLGAAGRGFGPARAPRPGPPAPRQQAQRSLGPLPRARDVDLRAPDPDPIAGPQNRAVDRVAAQAHARRQRRAFEEHLPALRLEHDLPGPGRRVGKRDVVVRAANRDPGLAELEPADPPTRLAQPGIEQSRAHERKLLHSARSRFAGRGCGRAALRVEAQRLEVIPPLGRLHSRYRRASGAPRRKPARWRGRRATPVTLRLTTVVPLGCRAPPSDDRPTGEWT